MSDDSKSNDGGWVPLDPVFQSTEGKTPRTAKDYVDPDDIDTAAPDFMEADTDEFDTDPAPVVEPYIGGDLASAPLRPSSQASPPPKSGSGCLGTLATMLGIATFLFAVLIAVTIYFLLFYTPRSTTF